MKTTIRSHLAAIMAAIACAAACGGKGASSSSSSHWVTCQMPQDCVSVPGAADCQGGYCVDSSGTRVSNDGSGGDTANDGGSGGSGGGTAGSGSSTGSAATGGTGASLCALAAQPGRELSIADCTERPNQTCLLDPPGTQQETLDYLIRPIVSQCNPPNESEFEVELENGCATKLVFAGSPAFDPTPLYDCVEAQLVTTRYACNTDAACSWSAFSTLR